MLLPQRAWGQGEQGSGDAVAGRVGEEECEVPAHEVPGRVHDLEGGPAVRQRRERDRVAGGGRCHLDGNLPPHPGEREDDGGYPLAYFRRDGSVQRVEVAVAELMVGRFDVLQNAVPAEAPDHLFGFPPRDLLRLSVSTTLLGSMFGEGRLKGGCRQ